jgi:acyl dehydratase
MHTDPAWAASDGPFGGLIASGIQTMGVWMRLMVAEVYSETAVVAGRELRNITLRRPLRPDMVVEASAEVLSVELESDARGAVSFRGVLLDEQGRLVFEHVNETLVGRRPA